MTSISLIISAGQNGADLGAFKAGIKNGIATRGFAKVNTRTPEFLSNYDLGEAAKYDECDRKNVDVLLAENGLVLAFMSSAPKTGAGSQKTINYALNGKYEMFSEFQSDTFTFKGEKASKVFMRSSASKRFALVLYDAQGQDEDSIVNWILEQLSENPNTSSILVTGSCEETSPGIQHCVENIINKLLS